VSDEASSYGSIRAGALAGVTDWEEYVRSLPLRERKKVRTKVAIQEHALRLFAERGYETTTVEEVAEAAEVATRTVFRYFPTKDELVLWDAFDESAFDEERLIELLDLSAASTPVAALVTAFERGVAIVESIDPAGFRQRIRLIAETPALTSAAWSRLGDQSEWMADVLARRSGLPESDPELRVVIVAMVATLFQAALEWVRADGRPEYGGVVVEGPLDGRPVLTRLVALLGPALEETGSARSVATEGVTAAPPPPAATDGSTRRLLD
jgi:AcrR family transcriptional regulator